MTDQQGMFDPPPEKPKGIRDPAMAVAVAKCIAHQLEPSKKFLYKAHPKECRYCKVPFERKMAALLEFNEWAGFTHIGASAGSEDWPDLRGEVEAYMRLPGEEQRKYAATHAGYDPEWYETNTGYEYPRGYGSHREDIGKGDRNVTDDKKAEGAPVSRGAQGDVGGRPGAGEPVRRGVGGPTPPERTRRRGIPDPEEEPPADRKSSASIPLSRYEDDRGNQPF